MDLAGKIAKAVLEPVKARKCAEQRKMRRPDVRRNTDGIGVRVQSDREQFAAGKTEDGPAVGPDIADLLKPRRKTVGGVERGQNESAWLYLRDVSCYDGYIIAQSGEAAEYGF